MKYRLMIAPALSLAALFMAPATRADGFETSLSLGLTVTDGNSETLQANASLRSEGRREELGAVRAGLDANYGESKIDGRNETTVENARLFVNLQKTLSARTFASLDNSLLYDDIARIDYRGIVAPGLGVYLIKTDQTSLSVESAPAYIWEKVADARDDYFAFRFAQRATHALSPTAKLWQSLEYLPKAEDFGDYLLNAEIGAEAAMTARMNLRLALQNKYDSTPGDDLEKHDLTLIAGISLSL